MKNYNNLIEEYKHLFTTEEMSPSFMFGIECGLGWFDIIEQLLKTIEWSIKVNKHPAIQITQIKEKFGGLRFYYDGGDDYIYGLASFAERMCDLTCEHCGSNVDIGTTSGWITTLCRICSTDEKTNRGNKEWMPRKERAELMKSYYANMLNTSEQSEQPKPSE